MGKKRGQSIIDGVARAFLVDLPKEFARQLNPMSFIFPPKRKSKPYQIHVHVKTPKK